MLRQRFFLRCALRLWGRFSGRALTALEHAPLTSRGLEKAAGVSEPFVAFRQAAPPLLRRACVDKVTLSLRPRLCHSLRNAVAIPFPAKRYAQRKQKRIEGKAEVERGTGDTVEEREA